MAKVDLEKHDLNSTVTVNGEYLYLIVKELKAAREVVEAAHPACIFIVEGTNVGQYRHLGNGNTEIDGEVWDNLNDKLNKYDEATK